MKEVFEKLPEKKKLKITNAAFKEFDEQGYEKASTNKIASEAGIGKGTLFYYFGNKKRLYEYLLDTAFDIAEEHYLSKIDYNIRDFFDRLDYVGKLKQKSQLEFPYALNFLAKVMLLTDTGEWQENILEKRNRVEEAWSQVLTKNIDLSKFREDLPPDKVLNLIRWGLEGYRSELEATFKKNPELYQLSEEELKPYYEDYETYISLLKKTYYK
ncbi:TetR/AcrR family transcriptional regulator [Marinilactibacillus kalidii]|uniref:TetR/AcrR family transcriptional regulator n=1 Tax=Marinilactibacillus kalidii TaxID=2820274 RepID=UPI001ABE0F01|nr:TetR/AcrR family transcriptional regulator [Marinilactibacillus kalidii]